MPVISFDELESSDLHIDAVYQGGRRAHSGDDPFPRLLQLSNQGGFRYRGDISRQLHLLVLTSTFTDPDWPDALDPETGVFTYFGDNKTPGRSLHDTGRRGNRLLRRVFEDASSGRDGRDRVPPILLFARTGSWRDVTFLGLAVPGVSNVRPHDDLVALWRTSRRLRFQNYRARFSVLDAATVSRQWIDSILAGSRDDDYAPAAWMSWRDTGRRRLLAAPQTIEHRRRQEQCPDDAEGRSLIETMRGHFEGNPHGFEKCASALAAMMIPAIATVDVTRPSRDGGRDAVGQMRVGTGPGSILVDFALEAKCYAETTSVGVRDMSRLRSRLRHRQFGIIVTTTWVDLQAYREIKEDQHPIVVIAAVDIVRLLRDHGLSTTDALTVWLRTEFPCDE